MLSNMMDVPLTVTSILERCNRYFGGAGVVWRRPDRQVDRYCYRDLYLRARRLGRALQMLGLQRGDRVATLMWNHGIHLEAYFGVPAAGGILHPLNLRLHPDEIAYIVNHARDRFLIVDEVLLSTYNSFRSQVNFEKVFVVSHGEQPGDPRTSSYEDLVRSGPDDLAYPAINENEGATMCFTSGTTGKPKGLIYSHRALVLHSLNEALPDSLGVSNHDVVLPAASMFHANGWGLPYTAPMVGAKLVLPGAHLDAISLLDLIAAEKVTLAAGVPTLWLEVAAALEREPDRWNISWPVRIGSGGSAVPEALLRRLDRFGFEVRHLWGMTETAPLASTAFLKTNLLSCEVEEKYKIRSLQGIPGQFMEFRVMCANSRESPWDGVSCGELEVRGPWVAQSYFDSEDTSDRWTADGWFRTGDIACINEEGYLKIVDRSKDLVKSGGEWISSVDLENALMSHPAVREAAVIAVPHPKWQERPLAVVIPRDGSHPDAEELRAFLATRFAKWQLPDAVVFRTELPHTSVGKLLKTKLREEYARWDWERDRS